MKSNHIHRGFLFFKITEVKQKYYREMYSVEMNHRMKALIKKKYSCYFAI